MIDIWKNRDWKPMLLKEIDKPFNSNDYIFELKFDGIRAIIFSNKNELIIQSRNNKNITHLFPELQEIKKLTKKNTIFDGEIIILDKNTPSFSKLQERLHLKNKNKVNLASINNPVTFIAFDILYENESLTELELIKRKKYLEKYKDTNYFIKTKMINKNGIEFFKSVKKLHLEGIVAKLKTGKYFINKRTDNFIKIKNIKRNKFIICGYEEKKNNIISLALGEYVNDKLNYVGKVSISKNNSLFNKVKNSKIIKNPFLNFNEKIKFINPSIECTIEYLERTKNNQLRHPIIKDI